MKTKTKLIIAIINIAIQSLNLFLLAKDFPELSIIISLISVASAFAVAVAVAFAVAVAVAGAFAVAVAVAVAFAVAFAVAVAVAGAFAVAVAVAEYFTENKKEIGK